MIVDFLANGMNYFLNWASVPSAKAEWEMGTLSPPIHPANSISWKFVPLLTMRTIYYLNYKLQITNLHIGVRFSALASHCTMVDTVTSIEGPCIVAPLAGVVVIDTLEGCQCIKMVIHSWYLSN